MFNGVPHDQLHQFIAAASLPLPLSSSFPLHHHNHSAQTAALSSNSFDISAYNSIPQHHQLLYPLQQQQQQQLLHPILQQSPSSKSRINEPANPTLVDSANNIDLQIERERPIHPHQPTSRTIDDPAWSNDELLALLRIRSTMENWLPDFTWEHVSRKLSENGFKRSGEKCKEKFEEESRYFNNNIINCTKTGRFFCSNSSELEEELYHQTQNQPTHHQNHSTNTDVIVGTAQKSHIRLVLKNQTHESAGFQDNKGCTSTTTTTADQTACLEDDQLGSPGSYNHHHQQTFDGAAKGSESDRVEEKADAEYHDSSTGSKSKKRKRRQKFEMFKGFCEEIMNKMMCQQEEMHNKLLEDMVKRDKEKVEKEEAWKKQEMDRTNKELEIMANEQAIAGDRQAAIIEFLNKFMSSSGTTTTATYSELSDQSQFPGPKNGKDSLDKVKSTNNRAEFSLTPSIQAALESPRPNSPTSRHDHENQNNTNIVEELPSSSSAMTGQHQNLSFSPENNVNEQSQQNPRAPSTTTSSSKSPSGISTCLSTQKNPIASSNPMSSITHKVTLQNPISSINDIKEDVGKRWPREQVLALINLRCSLYNSGADQDHHNNKEKEGGSTSVVKAPLWERISQGMAELGYKRSAKRCKEKWENINKYFRKTKDVNKKRSVDSRTCPYFHQLSTLYNKGTLVAPNNSEQGLQKINHHSSQLGSLANDHQYDIDHHHHHSPDVHVAAERERSDDINVAVHHQEVVSAAFDFEF